MENSMIVATSGDDRYRVLLEVVPYPANPRQDYPDDLVVHAVTVPNRVYPDVPGEGPLAGAWTEIKDQGDAVKVFIRYAEIFHGAVTLHDTGTHGSEAVWYMMPGNVTEVNDPALHLAAARDDYRAWAAGEVFTYTIEKSVDWVRGDGENGSRTTWEIVDDDENSGGNLIGYDFAEECAKQEFASFLQRIS